MRRVLTTSLLLCGLFAQSTLAAGLVGKIMPPYPKGLTDIGGSCVAGALGIEHICDYSIGVLADAAGKPKYLIAGQLAGREEDGKARWKITDVLPYPALDAGFSVSIATCRSDNIDDGTLVAVVRQNAESEYLNEVSWAARLELKTGKFVVLQPPLQIECVNEGFGL